ncbi:MAG: hypothetical protein PHP40_03000 [Eubacteriales bacterium]|nr:hypothetical protein [Eubacteriales bacterium]
MKTWLKKVNRGLILTLVAILAVTVYLTALSIAQNRQKTRIEAICRDYIALEAAWQKLPADIDLADLPLSDEEQAAHFSQLRTELAPYYIQDEQILDLAVQRISDSLRLQMNGGTVLTSYEKTVTAFSGFQFDGQRVTVEITTQTAVEQVDPGRPDAMPQRFAGSITDSITLQREGDTWRLLNASLNLPWQSSYREKFGG